MNDTTDPVPMTPESLARHLADAAKNAGAQVVLVAVAMAGEDVGTIGRAQYWAVQVRGSAIEILGLADRTAHVVRGLVDQADAPRVHLQRVATVTGAGVVAAGGGGGAGGSSGGAHGVSGRQV